MFQRLRNFHEALRNSKVEAAADKTFFFLIGVILRNKILTRSKNEPLLSEIEFLQ